VLIRSLKFFMHPDLDEFKRSELVPRFSKVVVDKPKESRKGTSFTLNLYWAYADHVQNRAKPTLSA
jgi:hypothetical protein